jgi:hypothetical protein
MGVTITILKRIPDYKIKIKISKGRRRSHVEEDVGEVGAVVVVKISRGGRR